MSVLIKDFEIPKHCADCDIAYYEQDFDRLMCPLNGIVDEFLNKRPTDCPLVNIESPHGKLIDADKLKAYWEPDHDKSFTADYFIHTIDMAQEIICAEGK